MALTNFSHPFGALAQPIQPWGATISPLHSVHQLASNTNNLLYAPADHQQQDDGSPPPPGSDFYKNNPYAPPQVHQQQQQQSQQQSYQYNSNNRRKNSNTYLPPIPPPGVARTQQFHQQQQQFSHLNTQQQQISNNNVGYKTATSSAVASAAATRTYGEGSYNRFPAANAGATQQPQQQQQYNYNSYSTTQTRASSNTNSASSFGTQQQQTKPQLQTAQNQQNFGAKVETPSTAYGAAAGAASGAGSVSGRGGGGPDDSGDDGGNSEGYPIRPPGFTRVQAGQGSRTQVHAVLDYDAEEGEEDYYDEDDHGERVNSNGSKKSPMPTVTPIQGPIFLKNGTVPVVPLFSYPTINNGSFVQIPIWWTALSVALGLDVRGDVIKGVPCIKRFHQLFCPTAGNSYPIDKIERFIDDNKALMRRMYGDFEMNMDAGGPRQQTKKRKRRFIDEPDIFIPPGVYPAVIPDDEVHPHAEEAGDSYFGKLRNKRQSGNQNRNSNNNNNKNGPNFGQNGPGNPGNPAGSTTGRLDACESKIEIVTPYWASNSAGKIRAIVNTQHFEQAIHQEICSKTQTPRCERDCGCEQKYKWHRLLAYDPDNDCKGIFMDWFLFPSCCVCRCNP